jgi:Trk-type K+ transport system membrane component
VGAALSIFVLLSLSVLVMRVASVALRLTGLSDDVARFQALSAFTGTGFTTREAESIVNYPVRRRIVSSLMIVGNLGLVTVLATLVVSLVKTEGHSGRPDRAFHPIIECRPSSPNDRHFCSAI